MKSLRSLLLFFVWMQPCWPVCAMVTKPALKQIEAEIRMLETNAIAELKKAFPLISESEWEETFKDIEKCKADLKIHLEQKDTAITTPSVYPANTPFVYEKFEAYTKKCAAARGINPEKIDSLIESSKDWIEMKDELALVRLPFTREYSLINNTWKLDRAYNFQPGIYFNTKQYWNKHNQISALWLGAITDYGPWTERNTILGKITSQCKFALKSLKRGVQFIFFQKQCNNIPIFEDVEMTLHHELTHVIEGHGISLHLISKLIEKYYGDVVEDNPTWYAFTKTHEYMAELMPSLLFTGIAQFKYNWAKFKTNPPFIFIVNKNEPFEKTHPTAKELLPWLERIVQAHSQS